MIKWDKKNLKEKRCGKLEKMKKEQYYIILAILACVLWSTAFVTIKLGYQYMNAPFTFAGLRFMLAGLILIPFVYSKKYFLEIKKNYRLIFLLAILQTFISYAIFYFALSFVGGAVAAITIGSGPVVVATMSHFMMENERMVRKKFISLLMGVVGIILIVISTKPMTALGLKETLGVLLLLLNSIIMGFLNIKIAKYKKSINPIILNSNQMFLGGLCLFIMGNIVEGRQNYILNINFYLALIWLAIVSALGFSIWFYLLAKKEVKVSELNMWKFVIPLLGAVLSWAIMPNESANGYSILGMLLISISFIYYYKKDRIK